MRKVLFLSKHHPASKDSGASLRNYQTIYSLKCDFDIDFYWFSLEASEVSGIYECNLSVDGISHLYSVRVSSRYSSFAYRLICAASNLIFCLFGYGLKRDPLYSPDIDLRLSEIMKNFTSSDIIILSEIWLSTYLNSIVKSPCKVIYDAHNAEAFLLNDMLRTQNKKKRGLNRAISEILTWYRYSLLRRLEKRVIQEADQVWTCSKGDAIDLMQIGATTSSHKFYTIPNSVDCKNFEKVRVEKIEKLQKEKTSGKVSNLVFIASFGYYPNQMAADFLINEICPRLRSRRIAFKLFLVGSSPPENMRRCSEKFQDIEITGRVKDTLDYLIIADIAIIPLFHGSGTRLKVLEAFAAGIPVISTQKGVEGIELENNVHALISDNADDMVEAIAKVVSEQDTYLRLSLAAFDLVKKSYSLEAVKRDIDAALAQFD